METVFGISCSPNVTVFARTFKLRCSPDVCRGSFLYVLLAKAFVDDSNVVANEGLSMKA